MTSRIAIMALLTGALLSTPSPASPSPAAEEQSTEILRHISGPAQFTIQQPRPETSVMVSVADFGASPSASPEKNAQAFDAAISQARSDGSAGVTVPQGVYRIKANRDAQLEFQGLTDFTFDGQGSELIFQDQDKRRKGSYIRIEDCTRFKFCNVTLDWDWAGRPLAAVGEVVAADYGQGTIDFKIHDIELPDDTRFLGGREWDPTVTNRSSAGLPLSGTIWSRTIATSLPLGQNIWRITPLSERDRNRAKIGQHTLLVFQVNYLADGIDFSKCRHITFDKVNIYGAPHTGFNAGLNQHFQITNCRIEPRPGTLHKKSVHSGFEIHNSFGYFRFENNTIRFTHDDGMHYSDYFLGGGLLPTDHPNQLVADRLQHYAAGPIIRIGDRMALRNADYSPANWSSVIESFEWQMNYYPGESAANRCIITFKDPIPDNLSQNALLFNQEFGAGQYIIRNNIFEHNFCHGLKVSLPSGLIENNTIRSTAYPALMVHMVTRWERWFIGTGPTNVIVRGNRIENSNSALREPASFYIGGGYDPNTPAGYTPLSYPVAQNILIENNLIIDSAWAAMGIWSTSNAVIRNNRIIRPNQKPSHEKYTGRGCAFIGHSANIIVSENAIDPDQKAHENGFFVDQTTTQSIRIENTPTTHLPEAPATSRETGFTVQLR